MKYINMYNEETKDSLEAHAVVFPIKSLINIQ